MVTEEQREMPPWESRVVFNTQKLLFQEEKTQPYL